MFGEILPNLASTIIVFFTLTIANNMLFEAALSFLGAGVQPPNSSWGTMITVGVELLNTQPLLAIIPGVMIMLTVLSLNIVGDGLRDALDPRSKVRLEAHAGMVEPKGAVGLMARFIVRRLVGMVARPLRRLGARLRDLQRPPQRQPGAAAGRQERDPDPGQEHRRRMGLRRIAAGAVRDDDEEGLHRRTDLLQTPDQRSRNRSSKGSRRRSRSASAPAIIWLFFGLLLGYLSAIRAGGWLDRVLTGVAIAGISIPVFLIAPVLLYFLTYKLEIFPNAGYVPLTEDPWEWLTHLILPWFTLAILSIGFYSRVLRSNMLDVMNEDYVRTARAKGLSERKVMTRHVLRNSLIPIITLFGLDFGATIAGTAIITEVLYSHRRGRPLRGRSGDQKLELPPIMGVALYGAFFVVFINALVDIAYAYLDPRVRLGETASA